MADIVLITGSSGYLSSAIIKRLAVGYILIGLDRTGLPNPSAPAHTVEVDLGEDTNYEFAIARSQPTPQPTRIRKCDRDRAEALRLAGGPKPSLRERAVALVQERGIVRTRSLVRCLGPLHSTPAARACPLKDT